MFQISAMINLKKPNLKGLRIVHALNITRTSENHEDFVSDSKLLTQKFPRKHVPMTLKKMVICSIISFYANLGLSVVIVSFCYSSMEA